MKLLCNVENGDVFYAVYDRKVAEFRHTTHIPLFEFHINEQLPENEDICIDLKRNEHAVSIEHRRKHQVIDGGLETLDGWERFNI